MDEDKVALPSTFLCRILTPDGSSRLQAFSGEHTVRHAINLLLDKIEEGQRSRRRGSADGVERWVLQEPGGGALLEDLDAPLEEMPHVKAYLNYRQVPLLRLTAYDDAMAYKSSVEVGSEAAEESVQTLIGHPMSWSSESEEVAFHCRLKLAPLASP